MDTPHTTRRAAYLLPNLLTSTSLCAAFVAVLMATQGRFDSAAVAIMLSALCDGLDGRVARLTNSASDFGLQYDSIVDVVAFGVAPAMLLYHWQLMAFGRLGLIVALIYLVATAIRLARFNVITTTAPKNHFLGLPSPAAGCVAPTLVLFSHHLPDGFLAGPLPVLTLWLTPLLALLMVSNVRYSSFKHLDTSRLSPATTIALSLGLVLALALHTRLLAFPLLLAYIASGPVLHLLLPAKEDEEDELISQC